ncbi:MAG: M23 family metallopeptidase, partial [Oscillibacter sp.]|nr:M23 family metallopeptidase [Oscillibacter sp.]
VNHEGGFATLYDHCDSITTASVASDKRGETIAKVGATGMATGSHLHFELHQDGVYLNPIYYVTYTAQV